jgi:hypothetical protein
MNSLLTKSGFVKLFLLLFFILADKFFGLGTQGKEGGVKVLAGLATSSQTARSLLRTTWQAKPAIKNRP